MKKRIIVGILALLFSLVVIQPLHVIDAASGSSIGKGSSSASSGKGSSSKGSSSSSKGSSSSSSGASSGSTATESSSGGGGGFLVPEWVTNLMDKIDGMMENIRKLMSGELVREMINKLMAGWGNEIATPLYGTLAKVFLFTPEIANISIIAKGWSVVMWVSLAIMAVSVIVLASKVFFAKQSLGKMLLLFVFCSIFVFYSLTVLHFLNVFVNYVTQKALEATLQQTGVGYQGITGADLLKAMVIGPEVFTNTDYQNIELGNLLVDNGGIFTMIGFISNVVVPFFYLAILKCLVLFFMTIMINIWVVYVAFTGKYDTLIGALNIYVRTLLVGFICSLSWGWFVRVQQEYSASGGLSGDIIGIAPVYFAQGVVIFEMIIFFFFWVKPLFKAMKEPLHMNGGQVLENMGAKLRNISMMANMAGKRLGLEGMQRTSLNMADKSLKLSKLGSDIKQLNTTSGLASLASKWTGGLSETVQGLKYERPSLSLKTAGSIVTSKPPTLQLGASKIKEGQLGHTPSVLKSQGFTETSRVSVAGSDHRKLGAWMEQQSEERKASLRFDEQTGELELPAGEAGAALYEELQQESFTLGELQQGMTKDGLFVDQATGMMHSDRSEQAEALEASVQQILPSRRKVELSAHDAKSVMHKLKQVEDQHAWVKDVQLDRDGLWVPQDAIASAMPVLSQLSTKQQQKQRVEAPTNAKFLDDMLTSLEQGGQHGAMLSTVEHKPGESHLYVGAEYVNAFQKAYTDYTQKREPYWRDKHGEVWIVRDQEAIPWGHPPEQGIDMGSFEALQRQMQVKHAATQAATSTKRKRAKTPSAAGGAASTSTPPPTPAPPASSTAVQLPASAAQQRVTGHPSAGTPPRSNKEKGE